MHALRESRLNCSFHNAPKGIFLLHSRDVTTARSKEERIASAFAGDKHMSRRSGFRDPAAHGAHQRVTRGQAPVLRPTHLFVELEASLSPCLVLRYAQPLR